MENTHDSKKSVFLPGASKEQIQPHSKCKLQSAKYCRTLLVMWDMQGFTAKELDTALFEEGLDILQVQ